MGLTLAIISLLATAPDNPHELVWSTLMADFIIPAILLYFASKQPAFWVPLMAYGYFVMGFGGVMIALSLMFVIVFCYFLFKFILY